MAGLLTRFAPSPTGYLHLGHVISALHARDHAGPDGYRVRIEDIDPVRCLPLYTQALLDDLAWLGLLPPAPIRRQSEHFPSYHLVLTRLKERRLLYPCGCTRQEVADASHGYAPDGSRIYPGTCRNHGPPEGRPLVWRLDMGRALAEIGGEPGWVETGKGWISSEAAAFGDVVLARRDTGVSYHLCVTHDDALESVDLVTRGMDLFPVTSVHRVLQLLLGYPEPVYAHHPLILGADGRKLSKRTGAEAIRGLRLQGLSAREVRALACRALEESQAQTDYSVG